MRFFFGRRLGTLFESGVRSSGYRRPGTIGAIDSGDRGSEGCAGKSLACEELVVLCE